MLRKQWMPLAFLALAAGCGGGEDNPAAEKSWELAEGEYRIGRGFEPSAAEPVRGDCISNAERFVIPTWEDAAGLTGSLYETRITSHEQLLAETNLTMSGSARSMFYRASASYSRYDQLTASEDNFTWLFRVDVVAGTKTLATDRISLEAFTPEARALIERARAGDHAAKADFQRLCGSKFVRGLRYGGQIVKVNQISASASSQLQRIHAEASGGGQGAQWKASGSVVYDAMLSEAVRAGFARTEVKVTGGEALDYSFSPSEAQGSVDRFVASLRNGNAAVIAVEMADWDTVVSFDADRLTSAARQTKLESALRQVWQQRQKLEKIDAYLYQYEEGAIELTTEEVLHLRRAFAEIHSFLEAVVSYGRACYTDADACGDLPAPVTVDFPRTRQVTHPTTRLTTSRWYWDHLGGDITATFDGDVAHVEQALSAAILGGETAQLGVQAAEMPCSQVAYILESSGPTTSWTTRGAPLKFVERQQALPNGRNTSEIRFAYREADSCFQLSFYTKRSLRGVVTSQDDSEAARKIRRIARAVRPRT
jgi:hypothetical protein